MRLKSHPWSRLATLVAVGTVTVGMAGFVAVVQAGPALADPTVQFAMVGSDTTTDVMNAFSVDLSGNLLGSYERGRPGHRHRRQPRLLHQGRKRHRTRGHLQFHPAERLGPGPERAPQVHQPEHHRRAAGCPAGAGLHRHRPLVERGERRQPGRHRLPGLHPVRRGPRDRRGRPANRRGHYRANRPGQRGGDHPHQHGRPRLRLRQLPHRGRADHSVQLPGHQRRQPGRRHDYGPPRARRLGPG